MTERKTKENEGNPTVRYYGKKRYALNPLIARVKQSPQNLPDYRTEECMGQQEFD